QTRVAMNEGEACFAGRRAQEAVLLHLRDRALQLRAKRVRRVEIVVIVQFDFAESRLRQTPQFGKDLRRRLLACIEERVLWPTSNMVVVVARERLIAVTP